MFLEHYCQLQHSKSRINCRVYSDGNGVGGQEKTASGGVRSKNKKNNNFFEIYIYIFPKDFYNSPIFIYFP